MVFLNPFKKYDVDDFPNVHIPLAEAPPCYANVLAENERRASLTASSNDSTTENVSGLGSEQYCQSSDDGSFTIGLLRAEVDADINANGNDSAYGEPQSL